MEWVEDREIPSEASMNGFEFSDKSAIMTVAHSVIICTGSKDDIDSQDRDENEGV